MFIIFGTGNKDKVETRGQFVCPRCSIKTGYTAKSSSQYITLFLFPVFPVGERKEPFVECHTCKSTYDADVLKNNDYNLDGSPFKKGDNGIGIEPENNETHTIKNCPNCQKKLRLKKGSVGIISCPSCQRKIYTSTK